MPLTAGSSAAIWTAAGSTVVGICAVISAVVASSKAARSVTNSKHLE